MFKIAYILAYFATTHIQPDALSPGPPLGLRLHHSPTDRLGYGHASSL